MFNFNGAVDVIVDKLIQKFMEAIVEMLFKYYFKKNRSSWILFTLSVSVFMFSGQNRVYQPTPLIVLQHLHSAVLPSISALIEQTVTKMFFVCMGNNFYL